MVLTLNTISGQIADLPPRMLEHPKFKDILEVVEEGAKPYIPELYKPRDKKDKPSRPMAVEEIIEIPEIEEDK